ncbi:GrpB family protein [Liquorilactobacillus uvarum]|uniref:GrpB family protein n=1 Tax=Liquorilactobacillus uvarum TaxID=303240 RepID=UPI00288AD355|nr:GrpB family protein [Liquorilactobacillus uvarum]
MHTNHIVIKKYDSQWLDNFYEIKKILQKKLNGLILSIEHVGSTSVVGLWAKPILDIDIVIKDYSNFELIKMKLSELGYVCEGDLGIPDRFAFCYDEDKSNLFPHHLYVCPVFSETLKRHIFLRNYLQTHEIEKAKYSAIKKSGANLYPDNISKYLNYKSVFIDELYKKM